MELEQFLSWFHSAGVKTENLNVRYTDQFGFGVYSRQKSFDKDSLILSIPEHLFIKPSFTNKQLTGFEHLIVNLLEDKTNSYIEYLRTIEPIPKWCFHLNDKYPEQLINKMMKHFNKYRESRNKFPEYNDQQFQWAYYTINTRCVYFDMNVESKEQDDNLCLIPYLDFINHSNEPNTITKFNPETNSYEIRSVKAIDSNEQITFLYNPHSNVDLFIEYGFVLLNNPSNKINIEYEIEQLLSHQQIDILKSFGYWNSLEFYADQNDLSWTILKAIELNINENRWSPYDDPLFDVKQQLIDKLKDILTNIKQNIENDFQQWNNEHFQFEKTVLFNDFLTIIQHTQSAINKYNIVS